MSQRKFASSCLQADSFTVKKSHSLVVWVYVLCFVSKYKSRTFLSQQIYFVLLTCCNYLTKTHVDDHFIAKFEHHSIVFATINQCRLHIFLIKMATIYIRVRFINMYLQKKYVLGAC